MKIIPRLFFGLPAFILLFAFPLSVFPLAFAGGSESARVVRVIKETNDLIVERLDGRQWLIEHHPFCNSMNTEFPVSLIVSNNKISRLKVDWNEICDVYRSMPYEGEARLIRVKTGENELRPSHEAEVEWNGDYYSVDYGEGCKYLKDFEGKNLFVGLSGGALAKGRLVLPGAGGQCKINAAKKTGSAPGGSLNAPGALAGLEYEAQNNQVYFYWEKAPEEKTLYVISYSRNRLNPSDYPWKQMPNLKYTRSNSYTLGNLANGSRYYIYLAAVSAEGIGGPWIEVSAVPKSPGGFRNRPDPDPFEVTMEEETGSFRLRWPARPAVRGFSLSLSADGKLLFLKRVPAGTLEYLLPKKTEYKGKGLRFTVRALPAENTGQSFYDGVYWEVKTEKN